MKETMIVMLPPKEMQGSLANIEEIEKELGNG